MGKQSEWLGEVFGNEVGDYQKYKEHYHKNDQDITKYFSNHQVQFFLCLEKGNGNDGLQFLTFRMFQRQIDRFKLHVTHPFGLQKPVFHGFNNGCVSAGMQVLGENFLVKDGGLVGGHQLPLWKVKIDVRIRCTSQRIEFIVEFLLIQTVKLISAKTPAQVVTNDTRFLKILTVQVFCVGMAQKAHRNHADDQHGEKESKVKVQLKFGGIVVTKLIDSSQ